MKRCTFASALLLLVATAAGAEPPSIAGTWMLTAAEVIRPDGTRTEDYGPGPHGLAVFTADGRYSFQLYRASRARFASGDKLKGTLEEYRDASLGMSAHFGTYSLDAGAGTITFAIDRASFPNWDGARRVSPFILEGDVLSWRVPARPDGSVPVTTLKRVR